MDLVETTNQLLERYGLLALFVLLALENLNVPLPSEPILLWGGYVVWAGDHSLVVVVGVCLAGTLVGTSGSWALGRWGGRPVITRYGRWIGATESRVAATDTWFVRHGGKAVLYGRVVPLVRTFVSVAAGMAHMPFLRFTALTALGALAWICLLVGTGALLGESWHLAHDAIEAHKTTAVAVIAAAGTCVVVPWLLWRRRIDRDAHEQFVIPVDSDATLDLRHRILRPGAPVGDSVYPGDDDAATLHAAAMVDDQIVAVASIYAEDAPAAGPGGVERIPAAPGRTWRLRGVATDPAFRRRGAARAVVDACTTHAAKAGGRVVWCNARIAAVPLYEALAWVAVDADDVFDIPDIGAHIVMYRTLDPA